VLVTETVFVTVTVLEKVGVNVIVTVIEFETEATLAPEIDELTDVPDPDPADTLVETAVETTTEELGERAPPELETLTDA